MVSDAIRRFDLHGSEISVNLDGHTRYRTYLGALCSVATFIIVIIYVNLRIQAIQSADPSSSRQFIEMINLGDFPY